MRLIDADALEKEDLCDHCEHKSKLCLRDCEVNEYNEEAMWQMIKDAPTIDAVEVVRCKDCVYEMRCVIQDFFGNSNGFCSLGERKTE